MSCPSPLDRRLGSLAFVLCCWGLTVCGCTTAYEATAPRLARAGDVEVSIERIRNMHTVEVRAVDVSSSNAGVPRLKAARLGVTSRRPCGAGRLLWRSEETSPELLNDHFELPLPPAIQALSQRGTTLDLMFDDPAWSCARLPLTSEGDEILWRGQRGWGGSGHLRLEEPVGSVGGIGAGVTAELRLHRSFDLAGTWRVAFGLPFGATACRGDCPDVAWAADDHGASVEGLFYHVGVTASLAREISMGPWLLLPTVGVRASAYLLAADPTWAGDRSALLWGPFVSIGVLLPNAESPSGFAPPPLWRRGIEVTFSALRAHDRAPEGIVWMVGLDWTFVDQE